MEILLILLVIALISVALLASRISETYTPYPYKPKQATLCSAVEAQFLTLLEKSVGDDYRVFTKVRLSDVVTVRNGISRSAMRSAEQKAGQQVLDFVLCDIKTMQVKAAIELEPAQAGNQQVKRNWFLKNTLTAASIPFLRFKAKPGYRVADMREYINGKIMQAEHTRAVAPKAKPIADDSSLPNHSDEAVAA